MENTISSSNFTIDVHTHVVPQFHREALISGGYQATDEDHIFVDGFLVPRFSLDAYMENRKKFGYHFSILSITCPGISFLHGNVGAKEMARKFNQQLFEFINKYPKSLGAFALIPLPNVDLAIQEVKVSWYRLFRRP